MGKHRPGDVKAHPARVEAVRSGEVRRSLLQRDVAGLLDDFLARGREHPGHVFLHMLGLVRRRIHEHRARNGIRFVERGGDVGLDRRLAGLLVKLTC